MADGQILFRGLGFPCFHIAIFVYLKHNDRGVKALFYFLSVLSFPPDCFFFCCRCSSWIFFLSDRHSLNHVNIVEIVRQWSHAKGCGLRVHKAQWKGGERFFFYNVKRRLHGVRLTEKLPLLVYRDVGLIPINKCHDRVEQLLVLSLILLKVNYCWVRRLSQFGYVKDFCGGYD